MAILEMIPPEYWAQLKEELNALAPSAFVPNSADTTAPQVSESPEERSARIRAQYDRAIEEAQYKAKLIREASPQYKAMRAAANARRAAANSGKPLKRPGRDPRPDEELTPAELEKRLANRAKYQERKEREKAFADVLKRINKKK